MGGSFRWPTLPEVMNYRDKVKGVVNDVIDSTLLQLPITPDSPWVSGVALNCACCLL